MSRAASAEACLAVDLGAESGRVLLGCFDGERVDLDEVYRFAVEPVHVVDGLHWDILRIMHEIKIGLGRAACEARSLSSIGIDAWGVDFGLLDQSGGLLSNPYHYRDSRTEGMMERSLERVSRTDIYRMTGIQFIPINTLYQLLAMEDSPVLQLADILLLIPDLIEYWLTGDKVSEFTIATTTQLYDQAASDWSWNLLERMAIPSHLFPPAVSPGSTVGPVLPAVVDEVGLREPVPVVAVASHDTASAVVAVPAETERFAYISSGTWSLVGVELRRSITTEAAMEANFTNEGGFDSTVRFLKNVMGLWLLQECRRTWAREGRGSFSYEELYRLADTAPAFRSLVDPDCPAFLPPGDMPARIRKYCKDTGQKEPGEIGETVRCVLESLALKYRWVVERAEELSGEQVEVLHVVGGGARNVLLCQMTAEATGRPVLAGPVEATALGNVMVQAYARGAVRSLEEIRSVVRRSTEVRRYEPHGDRERWNGAYARFLDIGPKAGQPRVPPGCGAPRGRGSPSAGRSAAPGAR
jgi:rhamnulokinase